MNCLLLIHSWYMISDISYTNIYLTLLYIYIHTIRQQNYQVEH